MRGEPPGKGLNDRLFCRETGGEKLRRARPFGQCRHFLFRQKIFGKPALVADIPDIIKFDDVNSYSVNRKISRHNYSAPWCRHTQSR